MAIRTDLLRIRRIRRLQLAALGLGRTRVEPFEVAVQLFDLSHQVRFEPSDLDARLPEAPLASAANRVVRVENANYDLGDTPLDDPLHTRELRLVANRAWL